MAANAPNHASRCPKASPTAVALWHGTLLIDEASLGILRDGHAYSLNVGGRLKAWWKRNSPIHMVQRALWRIPVDCLVLGVTRDSVVNHLNGNELDCRLSNLRLCR